MEEKQISGNSTTTTPTQNSSVVSPTKVEASVQKPVQTKVEQPVATTTEAKPVENKLFSQDEVNKIIAGRVKEVRSKFLQKYGINSESALDELIGKGQSHSVLESQLEATKTELENLKSEKLLRLSKFRADKFEEVKALLKGKNLPITEANIQEVVKSHPEWIRQPLQRVVRPLGNNGAQPKTPDEKDMVRKLFKSLK